MRDGGRDGKQRQRTGKHASQRGRSNDSCWPIPSPGYGERGREPQRGVMRRCHQAPPIAFPLPPHACSGYAAFLIMPTVLSPAPGMPPPSYAVRSGSDAAIPLRSKAGRHAVHSGGGGEAHGRATANRQRRVTSESSGRRVKRLLVEGVCGKEGDIWDGAGPTCLAGWRRRQSCARGRHPGRRRPPRRHRQHPLLLRQLPAHLPASSTRSR